MMPSAVITGSVLIDSPIGVLAGHDNRSYTDVKDYSYGTSTAS